MRKALCVGINFYMSNQCLEGCVNDAVMVAQTISRHADDSPNFDVKLLAATDEKNPVTKGYLRSAVERLFEGNPEIALLYYSGHGAMNKYGTYLCSSEIRTATDGLSLRDVMDIAEQSEAKHKIIILDCCHAGGAASDHRAPNVTVLPANTTILTACRDRETAVERGGHGLFTTLLLEALNGGAMNILGEITPGSVYAYVEKSLGAWDQRPVFKANIENFVCLRKHTPPIEIEELRMITSLFESPDYVLPLDISYEEDKRDAATEEEKVHDPVHEAAFAILRKYNSLNLLVPVGEEYMYWAAIRNKGCRLTPLGQYYWMLVYDGRI